MAVDVSIAEPIVQFTVLVAIVLVVQLTLERLHIPGLIGLLVMGMLLGPGGSGLLDREPVVELFGSVGLLYIMFLAGLEVDLEVAKARKSETVSFGLLAFVLCFLPAMGAGLLMGFDLPGVILLGAALSSHTLLAYPIVERLALLHTRAVVASIGGTVVTDTLALVVLVTVVQRVAPDDAALGWFGPLALLAALAALALLVLPRLAKAVLARVQARPAEQALFVLGVMLVLSVTADLIGTEAILGAFLAGLCLNRLVQGRSSLNHHLQFVGRMLFIPFFFIDTGMRLEVDVLVERGDVWLLAGLLLGAVSVGKLSAAWLTGMMFGYSLPGRMTMTGLTLPQAAATLAIVLTAERVGALAGDVIDAIIIVIFVSCLAGPLLTRFAGKRLASSRRADAGG